MRHNSGMDGMDFVWAIYIGVLILLCVSTKSGSESSGPYCVECDGAHSLADCNHHAHCEHWSQKCFLQVFRDSEHHDRLRYFAGCSDADTCHSKTTFPFKRHDEEHPHKNPDNFLCGQCCDSGPSCNKDLCSHPYKDAIKCVACDGDSHLGNCYTELCPPQMCYLQVYRSQHSHYGFLMARVYDYKFHAGCATSNDCQHNGHHHFREDDDDYDLRCDSGCHNSSFSAFEDCDLEKYIHQTTLQPPTTVKQTNYQDLVTTTSTPVPTTQTMTESMTSTTQTTTASTTQTTTTTTTTSNVMFCSVCNGTRGLEECTDFHACPGQHCYIEVYNKLDSIVYYGGCANSGQCAKHTVREESDNVPKEFHNGTLICAKCCTNESFCNVDLCHQEVETTTSVTTPSSMTTSSMTTTSLPVSQNLPVSGAIQQTPVTGSAAPSYQNQSATGTTQQSQLTTTSPPGSQNQPATGAIQQTPVTGSAAPNYQNQSATGTTQQSQLTTTSPPRSQNQPAIQCHQCSGPLCGVVTPGTLSDCQNQTPYCLNSLTIGADGSRSVTKKCGSKDECLTKWWLETSDSQDCTSFTRFKVYPPGTALTCHFCCTASGCNSDIKPPDDTLFDGQV